MNRVRILLLSLLLPIWSVSILTAQEVQVPDLTGLTIPEAAAQLNTVGLGLGAQSSEAWDASLGIPENTIGNQSVEAGSSIAAGTTVDVTRYDSPNAYFIYDENDVTFVNLTGTVVNMREILFVSGDETKTVEATEWGIAFAEASDCFQLWSIPAREAKFWEDCNQPTYWRSTTNPDFHFWTQVAGVTEFVMLQDGIERARCEAAPAGSEPIRCDFFMTTAATSDIANYLYMAYTTDSFVVLNNTADRWMDTNMTPFYVTTDDEDEEITVTVGEAAFTETNPVADVTRLAPGQCLHLTAENAAAPLAEDCFVIGQQNLAVADAFWQSGFELDNDLIGARAICPPATEGRVTICIMPR